MLNASLSLLLQCIFILYNVTKSCVIAANRTQEPWFPHEPITINTYYYLEMLDSKFVRDTSQDARNMDDYTGRVPAAIESWSTE